MKKFIKWIIIALILAVSIIFFIQPGKTEPGSVLAILASLVALLKSRLLNNLSPDDSKEEIIEIHKARYDSLTREKTSYDLKENILKEKIDSLDKKTENLNSQLIELAQPKSEQNNIKTDLEILEWINSI